MMVKLSRSLLFLSLTWWIEQSIPRTGDVGYVINCSGQCTAASSFQYSQCVDLFNILDIQHCNQPECSSKTYNLSACITAETGINTTFTTNQNANCQYNRDRDADTNSIATTEQSQACTPTTIYTETTDKTIIANSSTTAVAALATIVAILIVLLVMVLIALIWTCWTLKIKGTTKSQYQQHRIPNTLNTTNTYETARHVHNPVYGDTRPTRPSQTNQQLARDGKKIEHAYEVIPPTSTSNQHNSKQRGNTTGQAKTHNTGGGKPTVAGQAKTHNTGGAGGTLQVTLGGYKGQPQRQVGDANKKDDASERHHLDKGREENGCHKEENRYSHTRHFPKTVTKKPENHYSHTGHFQNSNAIKKPENHYSQTRHFPKSSTTKKPENQYSTTRHFPKSNATKKPDSDVNDHVYHALDMSGEKSDAHKDPQVGKNVYHILEEEAGDNSHIQEKENEYSALQGPGDDDDTCKNGQEGKHEYHVLEGPGDNSDTNADIQEGEHKYHVLEGLRDYSDTNMDIQEGEHKYHVLEGMTPELEGEEGEEQG